MKISNSKKHLARIISENGGWRDWAEWAAQDKSYCSRKNNVVLYKSKPPKPQVGESCWGGLPGEMLVELEAGELVRNWHQTILSRAEYFHLYPAPDAEPRFCESVMGSIPEPTAKPTIEQLATDYHNAKDYAERKQQEADDAKADAGAKLKALELAGEAIGMTVSPITERKEPELSITDWRDLQAGDVISVSGKWWEPDSEYTVDENDGSRDAPIRVGGYWALIGECGFKFIRRP